MAHSTDRAVRERAAEYKDLFRAAWDANRAAEESRVRKAQRKPALHDSVAELMRQRRSR